MIERTVWCFFDVDELALAVATEVEAQLVDINGAFHPTQRIARIQIAIAAALRAEVPKGRLTTIQAVMQEPAR